MRDATARREREDEDRERHEERARLRLVEPGETRRSTEYEPTYAENGRRTVTITGQPVPARRRQSPTSTQIQARPDRIALWAVLLGLFLVFMAVATAGAVTP
ncbi:MAG: hypothetical protein WKF32_06620 [Thermoleophilaceae bacterium]